jgi:hypothetical protein
MPKAGAKKIAVIYHASCPDGFGAALAAWRKFGNRYSQSPVLPKAKEIYFLDFTYKPAVMRRLAKAGKKIFIADHHISAKAALQFAHETNYDLKHSGAYLAWKYFHPAKPVPRLILHIEDEDIWKFKLKDTAAVNARLEVIGFDFKSWDKALRALDRPAARKQFIREGRLLAAYRTRMVKRWVGENAVPVKFQGYRTMAVNGMRPFTSEIGHALYKAHPPLAIIWQENRKRLSVSLRSNGTVDVAKIAAKFGGGGHKAAAAFSLPRGTKKPWTYEKITGK